LFSITEDSKLTRNPKQIFSDPELLRKAHLRLPRVAEIFEMLQQEGLDVKHTDYSRDSQRRNPEGSLFRNQKAGMK